MNRGLRINTPFREGGVQPIRAFAGFARIAGFVGGQLHSRACSTSGNQICPRPRLHRIARKSIGLERRQFKLCLSSSSRGGRVKSWIGPTLNGARRGILKRRFFRVPAWAGRAALAG